jgi:hypothetical protein
MTETWKWAPVSKIKQAAEDLKKIIRARYPDAKFILARAPDDRHIWLLWTFVDVADPDEVRELTRDREADLLAEDHIALYVSPRRSRDQTFGYPPQSMTRAG